MNHVTVEARALAHAMKLATAVVERRNTIPILNCVRLTYAGMGLVIEATDLDMQIKLSVDEIDGDGTFQLCIYATELAAIARAAGVAPLRIEHDAIKLPSGNMERAIITAGEARYEITSLPSADDWPDNIKKPRADLIDRFTNGMLAATLRKVAWAISTEETRYYLNGVAFQFKGGSRRFAATDGHRLAICRYGGETNADESRIIPRKAVAFIVNHFGGMDVDVWSTEDKNVIEIVTPAATLTTKLIDGTYPDFDRIIPHQDTINYRIEVDRQDITSAVKQATAIGGKYRSPAIRFLGIDGRMSVERKNADFGTATVKTSAEWPAGVEAFGFNSRYVLDIISNCQGAIRLGGSDRGSPHVIEDDDDTMTRVIMPMRT